MKFGLKAQGLPINTIILIAVGILILVLLITFVLGGFKALSPVTPSSLSSFSTQCSTYSTTVPASLGESEWCSLTTPNPSGAGTYHCYSDLAVAPGTNTTTIALSNGSTLGYSGASGAQVFCP
ncbi:MAG: hypothetical protein CSMARM5_0086 [Candidatus Parvarchaeum acidophilus ARMAN-5_'5-way FS']|jgi:hypothetical protein|uniref:Uncharacterized protein n=2 Tax=Parvarchaeum acidophilus TaxID=662761 RepID=D6GWJ7_PARA5|nr:MAG: hypothetical protein BJBARM5_0874 [Candidatus Parvarchaeum acidophilus ARMAN-5]EGD71939.1 MAG: hypothetical protein CSMARM5_0086 [Candidatus Parvarchaeum acidophilus ARMAN-5_'5-way FS']